MNTAKWTDIIANEAIDHFLDSVIEKRRLVESGLYTEREYQELCDFTGFFTTDYDGRFLWCKSHNVIEYRGRSAWSKMWYSSPVDHILTVYSSSDINVKGYKDGRHVLELYFGNLSCWDDYQREVTDKYHLLDNDPDFLGRRDTSSGQNILGRCISLNGPVDKIVLEDESSYQLLANSSHCKISGFFLD